jgi:AcrR family transcriptional regulator
VGRLETRTATPVPGGQSAVPTERGRRTRAALVKAARVVFEECGYLDARISDIAKNANVAHGTFYTYFNSKEEIFREIISEVQTDLLAGQEDSPTGRAPRRPGRTLASSIARIERANRAYVAGYRKHAKMLGLMEQVSTFNDDLRTTRLEMRRAFVLRSSKSLARLQADGYADPVLDPWYAANALCNMVDRFVYTWLVLGEQFEEDRAVATLTRLWAQAIKLPIDDIPYRPNGAGWPDADPVPDAGA